MRKNKIKLYGREGRERMRFNTIILCLFLIPAAFQFEKSFAQDNAYGLAAGDIINISVWRDESLTAKLVIPPDGVISFPLVGDINTTDLTIPALRKIFEEKISPFVPEPTVTIILERADSMTAYVVGKVLKPGKFPIGMDTSVVQLLAMAGGLNPYAAPDKMLILRQEDEKTTKIEFNYNQVEKGKALESNITVNRGDVLLVP